MMLLIRAYKNLFILKLVVGTICSSLCLHSLGALPDQIQPSINLRLILALDFILAPN